MDLKWGDKILLRGIREFEFWDRTSRRLKNTVDVFFWSRKDAVNFGVKHNVLMVLTRKNEA